MRYRASTIRTGLRAAALAAAAAASVLFYLSGPDNTAHSQVRRSAARRTTPAPRRYSAFPHDEKAHKIECGSCHKFPSPNWDKVRTGDAAFPDITEYPRHESCLNCHRQQFFKGTPPAICSICHVNPSSKDSRRHPFPNPREIFDQSAKGKTASSDFQIFFPHDKHIEIVTARATGRGIFRRVSFAARQDNEQSCSVCHKTLQAGTPDEYVTKPPGDLGEAFWLKKGTFKTVPTGHTTCFTCHSQDSGLEPLPTSCSTCHKLKSKEPPADFDAKLAARMAVTDRVTLDLWRTRHSSGKFQHEFAAHVEMSCSTCHNVAAMVTTDAATKKVPVASCATCHATATKDDGGVLNAEADSKKSSPAFQCVKCHIAFGKQPLPDSHQKAIDAAAGGK